MTIRQILGEYRNEIAQPDLPYQRGADILISLAALFGNINDEILKRELDYKSVLLRALQGNLKANRAKIEAETSPEYKAYREAQDAKELLEELIRSLKYWLKAKQDERLTTKYQEG